MDKLLAPWEGNSRRLWSFWDMINFQISRIGAVQSELQVLLGVANHNAKFVATIPHGEKNPVVKDNPHHQKTIEDSKKNADEVARLAESVLSHLKCPHIDRAITSLTWWSKQEHPSWADLRAKVIALRNAIDTELKQYFYYQYPKQKAQLLVGWKDEWRAAIEAFPTIESEVFSATDCYALGHNVASVFHSMRVLECGLRAIAADVGLTFDLQQWHNIIEQIESNITTERKTLLKGEARNERLRFLSEAAKEFFYFKDGWRNYVAHNRANYDEHQALGVLTHVRSFMNHLASQLSEAP